MMQRVSDGQRADANHHLPCVRLVACGVQPVVKWLTIAPLRCGLYTRVTDRVMATPGVQPKPPSKFWHATT